MGIGNWDILLIGYTFSEIDEDDEICEMLQTCRFSCSCSLNFAWKVRRWCLPCVGATLFLTSPFLLSSRCEFMKSGDGMGTFVLVTPVRWRIF
jgi:hypothetical protein